MAGLEAGVAPLTGVPCETTTRPCSSVAEHSLGKGEVARSIRAMGTRVKAAKRRSRPSPRETSGLRGPVARGLPAA